MRRFLLALAVVAALLGAGGVGLRLALGHAMPDAVAGDGALERAAALESAVHLEAWKRTGAVSFFFGGRHRHLWDRTRELHRVEFGPNVVLHDLRTREGLAWTDGTALTGDAKQAALDKAWALWCNDTFWLNPIAKLRDPGVSLGAVDLPDGREGLLVRYDQGGVTPGDTYLWVLGEDGLPTAWQMWVSIIPIPGLEASWEGWVDLPTGARVSSLHHIGPLPLEVTELEAAGSLAELVGDDDPFALLLDRRTDAATD